MKTLYFDCFNGISGDMTVGALIDAGASLEELQRGLASLRVPGFHVEAGKVNKCGIMATQFHVILHEHEHAHRHLGDIVHIINHADLPEAVKQAAIETFELLGRAEAEVHGMPLDQVHFHEVGAVDSIVDIVAAQHALYLLGVEEVHCSALHVGAGTVRAAHGIMPVPAPATALLLRGKPTYSGEVQAELVTPTGAALVVQRARQFGPAPAMIVERIGYGAGTRDFQDRANVVRVLIGERQGGSLPATETITVMEATIDDMLGELFPPLLTALLDAGARDAYLTPILGKKGRPAHLVTILCEAVKVEALATTLFEHSTTLGLRMREEKRIVLQREWRRVRTLWGEVQVKLGLLEGAPNTASPEYEDCARVAGAAGVPVRNVYEAALAAAVRGEFLHD